MTGIDPARFVFLDETSTPVTLTPLRARAARGQRAVGSVPRGQRPHIAWLATLTSRGLGESLLVRGTIDQRVFAAFVERVLVPSLHPGQIVILDNLAVHKSARVRALIADAGCHLVFLPPYSPDFNPIEQAFAKLKQALRRRSARSWDAVAVAVADLLPAITSADAHAFFADAGFPFTVQQLCTPLQVRELIAEIHPLAGLGIQTVIGILSRVDPIASLETIGREVIPEVAEA